MDMNGAHLLLYRRGLRRECDLKRRKADRRVGTCTTGARMGCIMHCADVVGTSVSWSGVHLPLACRGTEQQLKNSGMMLSGLRARKEESALYGDPVWKFVTSGEAELPFNRFAAGDAVILSAKFR